MRYAKNIKIVLAIVIINLFMLSTPLFSRATELPDEKYVNPYAKECPDGYTKIETVDDLLSINNNPSGNYILMNDIDLSETKKGGEYDTGHGWTPIKSFSGTLDGNGYRICNLTIYGNVDSYSYDGSFGGLFDEISGGLVKNLGLTDINIAIDGVYYVGGLCGSVYPCYTKESIVKCYVSGTIVVNDGVIGGIASRTYGTVKDCVSLVDIKGSPSTAGGIVGYIEYGNVEKCINRGSVQGEYCNGIFGCSLHGEFDGKRNNYYLSSSVKSNSGSVDNDEYQTSLTNSMMTKKGCFTGFDFIDTWEIDPCCEAYKYPQLKTNRIVRVLDIDIKAPSKRVYYQGDDLDLTDSKITVYYEGNDSFPAVINRDMLSGYDMSKVGKQTVTVTCGGIKRTFDIEVKEIPVESVSLPSEILIYRTDTKQLEADITPANATDKSLLWETSNSDIVTVDENGEIKAKSPGTAKITATSSNGKISSCLVTVGVKCSSIELNTTEIILEKGETSVLKAQMIPLDCTEKLKWKSSNENAVKVLDGKITAISGGYAVVTVYTDSGIEKKCDVFVIQNTKTKKPAKPNKVKGVKIKAKKGKLVISWKKVSNAERYEIFVSTKKNFSGKKKYYTSKKSITIPNIKAGKKHYIKIRGYNSYYDYYGEEAFVDGPWTTATKKAK